MSRLNLTIPSVTAVAAIALLASGCDGLFADLGQLDSPEVADAGDAGTQDADTDAGADTGADAHEPDTDECDPDQEEGFGGGSGTADDPYLVCAAAHLDSIRENLGDHFILTDDIDFSDKAAFSPIGSESDFFTGVFDGDGYNLTNLEIQPGEDPNVPTGIFAATGQEATISNLGIHNAHIEGQLFVGTVVGHHRGIIDNIVVESSGSVRGIVGAGGLAGVSDYNSTISGSFADIQVHGGSWVGGIAGLNAGEIDTSTNEGTIIADRVLEQAIIDDIEQEIGDDEDLDLFNTRAVGGIAGVNFGQIESSSGHGRVTARGDMVLSDDGIVGAGGVAGWNLGIIDRCEATRSVRAKTEVQRDDNIVLFGGGGLAGINSVIVENSHAEGSTIHVDAGDPIDWNDDTDIGEQLGSRIAGVGGLTGISDGRIENSYTTAGVTREGGAAAGGLVGVLVDSEEPQSDDFDSVSTRVIHSYAAGSVDTGWATSGLVAHDDTESDSAITDSFFDTNTTSHNDGPFQAGDGLSTDEFADENNFPGWDFTSTWKLGTAPDGRTRPVFQWQ